MKIDRIKPVFSFSDHSFFEPMQSLVEGIIPAELSAEKADTSSWAHRLMKLLPLFDVCVDEPPGVFRLSYLCPADFTAGVRQYVADMLTRWLIPGHPLTLVGSLSLNFTFEKCSHLRFFVAREILSVEEKGEWEIVRENLPKLIQEMKLNIQAVYQARYIASLSSISFEDKNKIIQENLSSLFQLPSSEGDRTLYDQMQNFLVKLSAEEKIGQVKKNIAQLRKSRPKAFDKDLFYEMTHFTILFRDRFSSNREPRHISRVIALHYLFKKVLIEQARAKPAVRHLSIKVFKTNLVDKQPTLGLIIGFNLLKDGIEKMERRQLVDAIREILPEAAYIQDSFIADRRDDKVRLFYLEIRKIQGGSFTSGEIKLLRRQLPDEIKKYSLNTVHPIFMPRNEEELLRNLILLSEQLKYVRDLPQVSIHYEKQSHTELSFTVLLTRLIQKSDPPLRTLIQTMPTINFSIDETRIMGTLKRKMLKEGAIIRASLDKTPFFRPDYSVDLLRARQKVVFELTRIVGEFRDYNGGMILKQDESLDQLRKAIGTMSEDQEFLLENYFYSLRPGIMQTVHEPEILKTHFSQLLELTMKDLPQEGFALKKAQVGKSFLYLIGAVAPTFKEYVIHAIEKLKIPSYDLTSTHLQIHDISVLGYILRERPEYAPFEVALSETLRAWKTQFSCPVNGR